VILQPLGYRVLLKRKIIDKVGSIVIPKTSKEAKVSIGEIVAVGDDVESLKVGDVVTFGRYAPHNIEEKELDMYGINLNSDKDSEILIMNEEDALCIVLDTQ